MTNSVDGMVWRMFTCLPLGCQCHPLSPTMMLGVQTTQKEVVSYISKLKRERMIRVHLLHPDNHYIHDSRSVLHSFLPGGIGRKLDAYASDLHFTLRDDGGS